MRSVTILWLIIHAKNNLKEKISLEITTLVANNSRKLSNKSLMNIRVAKVYKLSKMNLYIITHELMKLYISK